MAVKYEFSEHIIDRQYKAEQEMLAEFEAGNYTLENPLVKYNVYGINPLSAVVCFKTEEEVAITVTVLGKKTAAGQHLPHLCSGKSACAPDRWPLFQLFQQSGNPRIPRRCERHHDRRSGRI